MTIPALGIIEGFYGPNWTWGQRRDLIANIASHGFRRYVYAPKSDTALRREWAVPFSKAWLNDIDVFARYCAQMDVECGIGLSPYGLHQLFDQTARQTLAARLAQLKELKLTEMAILFDDMPGSPNMADIQAQIVQSIVDSGAASRFSVCPTYYSDDVVLDKVFGARPERYLADLCSNFDPSIQVFWTGEEVCSRQYGVNHLEQIADALGRKPLLWDNYPVNDGPRMSTHLHLRAVTGRPGSIEPFISGHYVNPALQPTLTAIPALTLALSYEQGHDYDYGRAFDWAAKQICGHDIAAFLKEDLLQLQDAGRAKLTATQMATLRQRYAVFNHPAAHEVVQFLDGRYDVSLEQVKTQ
jgi:hyaluronoglucosaminidase